ncbi:MAG TPA: hypothetical protein VEA81_13160 [Burkholderiaceae bacterium]|nr:hypothetical protein [Burkholderiaceae bacterium]
MPRLRRLAARTGVPLLLLAAALALPGAARAARPMVTDDARIVDAKACQVETWLRRLDAGGTEYWALPGCNPFGPFELTLGGATLPAFADGPRDRAFQGQVKTLFRALEPDSWGIGLAVGTLNLFPGDRGRSTRDPYVYVPVSIATLGERVVWHLNAGATHGSGEARRLRGTWGVGVEGAVVPRLLLVGETYGVHDERPLWQFGVRVWLVPGRVQVDATVGDQTGSAGIGRWATLGLRLLSPPFLP